MSNIVILKVNFKHSIRRQEISLALSFQGPREAFLQLYLCETHSAWVFKLIKVGSVMKIWKWRIWCKMKFLNLIPATIINERCSKIRTDLRKNYSRESPEENNLSNNYNRLTTASINEGNKMSLRYYLQQNGYDQSHFQHTWKFRKAVRSVRGYDLEVTYCNMMKRPLVLKPSKALFQFGNLFLRATEYLISLFLSPTANSWIFTLMTWKFVYRYYSSWESLNSTDCY